jgi:hypothetical protein
MLFQLLYIILFTLFKVRSQLNLTKYFTSETRSLLIISALLELMLIELLAF